MANRSILFLAAGLSFSVAVPSHASAASYQQLYAFKGGADGAQPVGHLTLLGNVLYGTTRVGGGKCNCGTVYRMTVIGAHHVLHDFAGKPADGAYPGAGVVPMHGDLYGTTTAGGAYTCQLESNGCGTVFRVTPAGALTLLHSFQQKEGSAPAADLLVRGSSVWGTASFTGGVFETLQSGTTRSFVPDAVSYIDSGGLINVDRTFYGAAFEGGQSCGIGKTGGSVYAIAPGDNASTLYAFKCRADGQQPSGTLLYANGLLYGTTETTVFSLTLSGIETVLYTFSGSNDAAGEGPGLTAYNGLLYSVSPSGGGTGCGGQGCGTIYSVTPSGVETVVYRFQGGADGAAPSGRLLNWQGALYGVTSSGGSTGAGTVFHFTP